MNKHQARHYCTLTVVAGFLLIGSVDNREAFYALFHILLFGAAVWLLTRVLFFPSDRE